MPILLLLAVLGVVALAASRSQGGGGGGGLATDPTLVQQSDGPAPSPSGPALVWVKSQENQSDLTVDHDHRYAALVSLSQNFTVAEVTTKLQDYGFETTYAWEQGTPTRGQYLIDDALASMAPDPRDNHRWVWLEGNAHQTVTKSRDCPLPFCTIYYVAHLYEAMAPAGAMPGGSGDTSGETGRALVAFNIATDLLGVL